MMMMMRRVIYILVFAPMKMERKESSPEAVGKKKKKRDNRKRFNGEQIRFLESMFQEETKPEPQRKLELARELGLQPRQIAIWFQNRRARRKSHQLEQDYSVLRASYNELASRFDSLMEEKQSLLKQLQKLRDLMEKKPPECNRWCRLDSVGNSSACEEKPTPLLEEVADMEEVGVEEHGLVNNSEATDGFVTLPEDWCGFDSGCFSDQSSSSLSWWGDLWH